MKLELRGGVTKIQLFELSQNLFKKLFDEQSLIQKGKLKKEESLIFSCEIPDFKVNLDESPISDLPKDFIFQDNEAIEILNMLMERPDKLYIDGEEKASVVALSINKKVNFKSIKKKYADIGKRYLVLARNWSCGEHNEKGTLGSIVIPENEWDIGDCCITQEEFLFGEIPNHYYIENWNLTFKNEKYGKFDSKIFNYSYSTNNALIDEKGNSVCLDLYDYSKN